MSPKASAPEVEAPAEAEAPAPVVEGAVTPPYFVVGHSDGQQSIIPVDYGCIFQVIDPFGAIKATVAVAGVNSVELVL
jgi:hypothetical protein